LGAGRSRRHPRKTPLAERWRPRSVPTDFSAPEAGFSGVDGVFRVGVGWRSTATFQRGSVALLAARDPLLGSAGTPAGARVREAGRTARVGRRHRAERPRGAPARTLP